jgi:predicted metal-binding protein
MLLFLQVWKEQLYPRLKQHLADHVDSTVSYLVLYHEAAVANLLEVSGVNCMCSCGSSSVACGSSNNAAAAQPCAVP